MDYFGLNPTMLGSLLIFLGVKRLVQVQTGPFEGPNSSKMGWGVRPSVTNWTIMWHRIAWILVLMNSHSQEFLWELASFSLTPPWECLVLISQHEIDEKRTIEPPWLSSDPCEPLKSPKKTVTPIVWGPHTPNIIDLFALCLASTLRTIKSPLKWIYSAQYLLAPIGALLTLSCSLCWQLLY